MKSSIYKLFLSIFLFVGVSTQAQETVITKNELPQSAQKFISDNFSNHTLDYIKKDKEFFSTDYQVKFTDGTEIDFDSDGDWTEVDGDKSGLPTGFIHNNIVRYVKEHFANATIVRIEKGRFGKQEVKLSNGLELEFNAKGEFKRIDD